MTGAVAGVVRGCGRRIRGGAYAECGLSPYGKPVEHFLMDPPVPLDPALELAAQGMAAPDKARKAGL